MFVDGRRSFYEGIRALRLRTGRRRSGLMLVCQLQLWLLQISRHVRQ